MNQMFKPGSTKEINLALLIVKVSTNDELIILSR